MQVAGIATVVPGMMFRFGGGLTAWCLSFAGTQVSDEGPIERFADFLVLSYHHSMLLNLQPHSCICLYEHSRFILGVQDQIREFVPSSDCHPNADHPDGQDKGFLI